MSGTDIVLSKESANDETASVAAIYVATGIRVEDDQLIFDIESSKATQEIRAPSAGILAHELTVGQAVGFGVSIARIVPFQANAAAVEPQPPPPPPTPMNVAPAGQSVATLMITPEPTSPSGDVRPAEREVAIAGTTSPSGIAVSPAVTSRFSRAAAALIATHGLSEGSFPSGFVTTEDVLARQAPPSGGPPLQVRPQALSGQKIDRRKRAEIEALSRGAGGTLLSVLGVTLGSVSVQRRTGAFLQGKIVDLVIYEAARLMKKFPKLNAGFDDGRICLHDAVHAGLAIDGGGRLVVYGIENADRIGLHELSDVISDAVARYVDNTLTSRELSRATFTVTDLSDGGLDFILPLLPRGQSCILGIARNGQGVFRLFAGFDHRVTEGREVALFLNELRERIVSFSAAAEESGAQAHCLYCERSAVEAVEKSRDKGLLRIVDRSGRDALCCASCWNGW